MKAFDPHQFDPVESRRELDELAELLRSGDQFSESKHIRPFFRRRRHLAALLKGYAPDIVVADLLAFEYELFGDFICDLAVGDSRKNAYLLVEFEEAGPQSVFVSRGRSTPDWSPRFEHGYSQIIDWLYKLADVRPTAEFAERFGARDATFSTLLVVGRRSALAKREQARLAWRKQNVVVDSKHVHCVTFDELLDDLQYRPADPTPK